METYFRTLHFSVSVVYFFKHVLSTFLFLISIQRGPSMSVSYKFHFLYSPPTSLFHLLPSPDCIIPFPRTSVSLQVLYHTSSTAPQLKLPSLLRWMLKFNWGGKGSSSSHNTQFTIQNWGKSGRALLAGSWRRKTGWDSTDTLLARLLSMASTVWFLHNPEPLAQRGHYHSRLNIQHEHKSRECSLPNMSTGQCDEAVPLSSFLLLKWL